MPKLYEQILRKHPLKRQQSSRDSKSWKAKKGGSISPIHKQVNLHANKENIHPNKTKVETTSKPTISSDEIKKQFYAYKYEKIEKKLPKQEITQERKGLTEECRENLKQLAKRQRNQIKERSIQKCQVGHHSQPVEPSFIVEDMTREQYLACEVCAQHYKKKIPIKRMMSKQLDEGNSIKTYCQKLNSNLQILELFRSNTLKYREKYKAYAYECEKKHREYYYQMFEVIEQAMTQSEKLLIKKTNEIEELFAEKLGKLDKDISRTKYFLGQLLSYPEKETYNIKVDEIKAYFNYNPKKDSQICLPYFRLVLREDLLKEFTQFFKKKCSIKILSEEDLIKKEPSHKTPENRNQPRSNYSCSPHYPSSMDTELFCDEALGPTASVNNFSFDGEAEVGKIVPIIELTEEEEIISPAFKDL